MTFQQISQRCKKYLNVETLLRAAQTMTDRAIAGRLKALADDCQRQVRKPRLLMRPKHSLDRRVTLRASDVRDLMISISAQPAEETPSER